MATVADAWRPTSELEHRLQETVRAGDQEGYFRLLADSELVVPVAPDLVDGVLANETQPPWPTQEEDGRVHVLAYTSASAMRACLGPSYRHFMTLRFGDLAETWPDARWWLAVDAPAHGAGTVLPIEARLPAWFVRQVAEGDGRPPRVGRAPAPWEELRDQHRDLPRRSPRPEFQPANDVERELLRAAANNDHDLFLQTLADTDVLLPVPDDMDYALRPGRPGFPWQTREVDGATVVPVFTSPERLTEASGPGAEYIKLPFTVALRYWPNHDWLLAINSGSPAGGTVHAQQLPGLATWADQRAAQRMTDRFEPQNDIEQRLFEVARRRDTDTFYTLLLGAQVLVPADADTPWGIVPGDPDFPWRPVPVHGRTSIQVFTSLRWMNEAIGSSRFIMPSLHEMIAAWPDTDWTLVLNPGTPIDASMPGDQIRTLRGPATPPSASTPPPPETPAVPVAPAVPSAGDERHGTLGRHAGTPHEDAPSDAGPPPVPSSSGPAGGPGLEPTTPPGGVPQAEHRAPDLPGPARPGRHAGLPAEEALGSGTPDGPAPAEPGLPPAGAEGVSSEPIDLANPGSGDEPAAGREPTAHPTPQASGGPQNSAPPVETEDPTGTTGEPSSLPPSTPHDPASGGTGTFHTQGLASEPDSVPNAAPGGEPGASPEPTAHRDPRPSGMSGAPEEPGRHTGMPGRPHGSAAPAGTGDPTGELSAPGTAHEAAPGGAGASSPPQDLAGGANTGPDVRHGTSPEAAAHDAPLAPDPSSTTEDIGIPGVPQEGVPISVIATEAAGGHGAADLGGRHGSEPGGSGASPTQDIGGEPGAGRGPVPHTGPRAPDTPGAPEPPAGMPGSPHTGAQGSIAGTPTGPGTEDLSRRPGSAHEPAPGGAGAAGTGDVDADPDGEPGAGLEAPAQDAPRTPSAPHEGPQPGEAGERGTDEFGRHPGALHDSGPGDGAGNARSVGGAGTEHPGEARQEGAAAVPGPRALRAVEEPEPVFEPGNRVDQELYEAALSGDPDAFLRVLLNANVLVPIPDEAPLEVTPMQREFRWDAALRGESAVQVFTSLVRLREVLPQSRFVYADFRELIGAWPRDDWAMLLNPGTRIGASLQGDQVRALSEWAMRIGLVPARPEVPLPPPRPEPSAAQLPSDPDDRVSAPTIMQKVVPHGHVAWYLEQGYDRVGGFVHSTADVAELQTPVQLYEALGLLYADSSFSLADEGVYVIRWPAYCPDLYRVPFGGQDEAEMAAWGEAGWVIERPPFLGGGFAPGSAGSIREYKVDSVRLPYGAEMYYLGRDRSERFVAMYDPDRLAWLRPEPSPEVRDGWTEATQ
ncbi:SseB family protein [Actinomadura formosensis]|uniref:SseB family protein n=1 Tax=Actinomadura formosensis TaxID=60706 RepID=UPI003D8FF709